MSIQTHTVIIGASVAGLACAAALRKMGIDFVIVEKQSAVASPWRNHYDRLHLHTNRSSSNLPYKSFDQRIPKYPSRQQVVDYLEAYQNEFDIKPVFEAEAMVVIKKKDYWYTGTTKGTYQSKYVIVATGAYGKPKPVHFPGVETFPGKVLHSSQYKSGKEFAGKKVLVVGFGNSACEIAIDLYEQGATPAMSVRSPVNVVPRDIFGIPILKLGLLMSYLPARLADVINAPVIRLLVGDLKKLGLRKLPYGPMEQIQKEGTVPLLDIGTIGLIRKGRIKIHNNIERIDKGTVFFEGGEKKEFDAIVAGIGYTRNYSEIIEVDPSRFDDLKVSVDKQKYFGKDGLYFCGFWIAPSGQFREIALDAKKIAIDIGKRSRKN